MIGRATSSLTRPPSPGIPFNGRLYVAFTSAKSSGEDRPEKAGDEVVGKPFDIAIEKHDEVTAARLDGELHRLALASASSCLDDGRTRLACYVSRRVAGSVVHHDDLVDQVDAPCFSA